MKGSSAILVGGVTVLVAIAALGFILWNTTSIAETCKTQQLEICDAISGPNFSIIMTTLIISGLVLVASTVVYILVAG